MPSQAERELKLPVPRNRDRRRDESLMIIVTHDAGCQCPGGPGPARTQSRTRTVTVARTRARSDLTQLTYPGPGPCLMPRSRLSHVLKHFVWKPYPRDPPRRRRLGLVGVPRGRKGPGSAPDVAWRRASQGHMTGAQMVTLGVTTGTVLAWSFWKPLGLEAREREGGREGGRDREGKKARERGCVCV